MATANAATNYLERRLLHFIFKNNLILIDYNTIFYLNFNFQIRYTSSYGLN